jgi:hypothetical protein
MPEVLTKNLNSNLNPDGKGFAENSNLSTHYIDGNAILLNLKILNPIVQRMWIVSKPKLCAATTLTPPLPSYY